MPRKPGSEDDAPRGLKFALRAFRSRNYRLFFGGQGISLIGTWMQSIAMSWLVYRLTHSPGMLGMVMFAGQCPTFLFGPFAGVLGDRLNRRSILVVTQTLSMLQAFVLAALVLTDAIQVWHVIFLSVYLGAVNAFDIPIRQAFVVEMTDRKEDLPNAIALNSSMFNAARLVGPSVAGLLIGWFGEGICFLLNAVSYLTVIGALLAMRIPRREAQTGPHNALKGMKEGFAYAFGSSPIRSILLLLSLVSLMGMPYAVLMPMFAKDMLHGGPHTQGFLMSCAGAGALTGAVYLASRRSVLGLGRIIPIATCLFAVGLVGFAQSRIIWVSAAMLMLAGFGMMVQMASCNTLLQTIVEDQMRGRVMAFYTMSFMGMAPIGSLFAGSVAGLLGPSNTVMIGGFCCAIGAIVFARNLPAFRASIRPIYVSMGIIPEIATGLQSASTLTTPPEE